MFWFAFAIPFAVPVVKVACVAIIRYFSYTTVVITPAVSSAISTTASAVSSFVSSAYTGVKGLFSNLFSKKDKNATPDQHPEKYRNVKGRNAKKNKETGEIWVEDKSGHGGRHWEVYKNRRDWIKGWRDRSVSWNGRLIKKQ
jgi:hypothetical protein